MSLSVIRTGLFLAIVALISMSRAVTAAPLAQLSVGSPDGGLDVWGILPGGADGDGVVSLSNWPSLTDSELSTYDILPKVETLSLAYRYGTTSDRPYLDLTLEWIPAGDVIYDGHLIPLKEVAADVRMVALELEATARSAEGREARLYVVVDSMALGPVPDRVSIDLGDLSWETVFENTSGPRAREMFASGFELHNLEISSVAFAAFAGDRLEAEERVSRHGRRKEVASRPAPTRVSVYQWDTGLDLVFNLHWLFRTRHVAPSRRADEFTVRGEMGRGDASRTVERSGSRAKERSGRTPARRATRDNDDDDDDENVLAPAALAAVAAAGILAIAGGTIGYYGHAERAPLGLTSGLIGREGGLLLQVGVNEALISGSDGQKHLIVKLLSYGNLFRSPVQPALGAGVLATAVGSRVSYEPSMSVGGVGSFGALLVFGGYDISQGGPELSLALNLRHLRQLWSREEKR